MSGLVGAFARAYVAAATPAARRLHRALDDPRRAQLRILRETLAANRDSEVGRRYGFGSITSYGAFAARVPLSGYDDLHGDITRVARGEPGVLTGDAVSFLEPTGGSSGPAKLIPYTPLLKRQIGRAVHPWIRDLLVHRPELRDGRAYWAVSPPARVAPAGDAAVPIGAPHDLEYLPSPVASLLERTFVLPRASSEIEDLDVSRYVTLRALLAAEDLALISVWNPSFLTILAGKLDAWFEMLVRDLERGSLSIAMDAGTRARIGRHLLPCPDVAARLRRRFGSRPPEDLGALWPRLLISCWTDGHAARALDAMRRRFPNVEVQGKGLIATEGVVSVPLMRHPAPAAAVASHFLEFLGDGGDARLVDELETGTTYEVVLTTGGGLYRYRLKDVVRVEGRAGRTPLLRFVGRADASDLCGEKLTPAFVETALTSAARTAGARPAFAVVAPRWGAPPRYDLWVELDAAEDAAAQRLAHALEAELRRGHHYDLCRALGQLDALQVRPIRNGERSYERACMRRGQRAGAVKPPALITDPGWGDVFEEVTA
ncbi:MAG: GH3 auxin-responsive promoter family protein [Actinomycetota bacterium]